MVKSLFIAALALIAISCFVETESGCTCASTALVVSASTDSSQAEITLDSLKYQLDNDTIVTIREFHGFMAFDVGYQAGQYQLWAYYQGAVSDTVHVQVSMGGPENCRRPNTQRVHLIFDDGGFSHSLVSNLGGCGQ